VMAMSTGFPSGKSKLEGWAGGKEMRSCHLRPSPLARSVRKGVLPVSKLSGVAVAGIRPSWMILHCGAEARTLIPCRISTDSKEKVNMFAALIGRIKEWMY